MTKGVDIIIGDITINRQSAESGSYGNDSLASGVYQAIETYDDDFVDVLDIETFPVGTNKTAVVILHN